jgi:hypothetical protein
LAQIAGQRRREARVRFYVLFVAAPSAKAAIQFDDSMTQSEAINPDHLGQAGAAEQSPFVF